MYMLIRNGKGRYICDLSNLEQKFIDIKIGETYNNIKDRCAYHGELTP